MLFIAQDAYGVGGKIKIKTFSKEWKEVTAEKQTL